MADYDDGNFNDGKSHPLIIHFLLPFHSSLFYQLLISENYSIDVDEGVIMMSKQHNQKGSAQVSRVETRPPVASHYGGAILKAGSRMNSPKASTISQSGELSKVESHLKLHDMPASLHASPSTNRPPDSQQRKLGLFDKKKLSSP